jgi:hypothetical protein
MSARATQLAQRRLALQALCAIQRRQLRAQADSIQENLQLADRWGAAVLSVTKYPWLAAAAVAALGMMGPHRLINWLGRATLALGVLRKFRGLIGR